MILIRITVVFMEGLFPLIPEERVTELIEEKMRELNVSQRDLEDELDIPQPLISRSLKTGKKIKREFKYSEVQSIVQYLLLKRSLIPSQLKAIDFATKEDELVYAYDDESVREVALKLKKNGFSQIPIKDRVTGVWSGVVTDLGILRMLLPFSKGPKFSDRTKIGSISIRDSGLLEGIVDCPYDESLVVVANILLYFYAILLKNERGDVKGIITRADILKLMTA